MEWAMDIKKIMNMNDMPDNRRVIMITKKGARSEPDEHWKAPVPGDHPDPTSTNRFTSPLRESTARFTTPLKESTDGIFLPDSRSKPDNRFSCPLRESTDRFTSPLKESTDRFRSPRESTDRFTAPMQDSSERYTTPLYGESIDKNRGRNSSKFKSKKRDSWEGSDPPSRDRERSPHKYSHDPPSSRDRDRERSPHKYSHDPPSSRDRGERSPPKYSHDPSGSRDRERSPHKYSHEKFRSTTPGRNENDSEKRSHSADYYRRNGPPPKDRRLSPSRDSYNNFKEDGSRPNSHNHYDRENYTKQPSSRAESTYSNPNPDPKKRPFADATILITTSQLRNYAERIERRLKNINMSTEIRNMPDALLQSQVIEEIARQGVVYVIIVNSQNEAHQSLTLHIFQGTPQEHRNMPSDDAMSLVARNFERYLQVLKEKNAGQAATAAPSTPSTSVPVTPPITATTPSSHHPPPPPPLPLPPPPPPANPNPGKTSPHQQGLPFLPPSAEISYLLNLLADFRHLTLQELDKVIDYLKERKRQFLEMPPPNTSMPPPSTPKGAADFSSGDDLQRMDKNRLMSPVPPKTDFQSKILSMIMPSNTSDNNMNPNMNNSLQQSAHNLPGQPIRSGEMIPQSDQALQSVSANNSNMTALINFDNPTVKKALDNLIQSGPSLLQNINAVSKNTAPQHLSANPLMDRNPQHLPPNPPMDRNPPRLAINPSMDRNPSRLSANPSMDRNPSRLSANPSMDRNPPRLSTNPSMDRNPPRLATNLSMDRNPPRSATNPSMDRNPPRLTTNPSMERNPQRLTTNPSMDRNPQHFPTNPSMDRNPQHMSTNLSMDRSQDSYKQYSIPQSVDRAGPPMMSRMSGGVGGGGGGPVPGNVLPNMGMNAGMNMDPMSQAPHFNRGANMYQNSPQMMGRGPPGPLSGPYNDMHPHQY